VGPCRYGMETIMRPFAVPTTDAFMIETARHTAGIAVRERRGFRFYASDQLFYSLDNRTFGGLRELWAAIDRCAPPRRDGQWRRSA
jgi:hypothetical protein